MRKSDNQQEDRIWRLPGPERIPSQAAQKCFHFAVCPRHFPWSARDIFHGGRWQNRATPRQGKAAEASVVPRRKHANHAMPWCGSFRSASRRELAPHVWEAHTLALACHGGCWLVKGAMSRHCPMERQWEWCLALQPRLCSVSASTLSGGPGKNSLDRPQSTRHPLPT